MCTFHYRAALNGHTEQQVDSFTGQPGTDLKLPPTASTPRQILKAEAPLVV